MAEKSYTGNHTKLAKAERLGRIQEVMDWVLEGIPSSIIIRRGMKKWDVSNPTMSRYLKDVHEKHIPRLYDFSKSVDKIPEFVGKAQQLYARCLVEKQYGVALQTLKWIAELQGVGVVLRRVEAHAEIDIPGAEPGKKAVVTWVDIVKLASSAEAESDRSETNIIDVPGEALALGS